MREVRDWLLPRLRTEWRFKVALSLLLPVVFCVPYFALQHFAFRDAVSLPLSLLDRAVPFQPGWIWGYQSLYLLLPVFPWIATERRQLNAYTRGFLYLCASSFICFAFFPVECPRPIAGPESGMYALIISYDGVRNAFPSLHVGLAAHAVLFGGLLSSEHPRLRRWVVAIGGVWLAVIGYSTLATKQHYFVDLPMGVLLAYLSHRVAGRNSLPAGLVPSISLERSRR